MQASVIKLKTPMYAVATTRVFISRVYTSFLHEHSFDHIIESYHFHVCFRGNRCKRHSYIVSSNILTSKYLSIYLVSVIIIRLDGATWQEGPDMRRPRILTRKKLERT